ncbi:hypothetical protein Ancab_016804 [Ancistrocladus abbreviatus]
MTSFSWLFCVLTPRRQLQGLAVSLLGMGLMTGDGGCHSNEKKDDDDKQMPCSLCYMDSVTLDLWLGKMKVKGTSANDPTRLMKSPMKGMAAATNVLAVKNNDRRKNLRFKFPLEYMPSSQFKNLVSSTSCMGCANI